jgi:glutathione S-transferase
VTVPVLFDDGQLVRESFDIARHAETIGRGEPLFPEGREADVAHWNGLADVISRAGRALLTPRLAKSPRALEESMPSWIPGGLRRASVPVAEATVKYIARKHAVRPEEAEQDRGTIRWTLRKLRQALEKGDYVLEVPSFADVAMVAALQTVRPSEAVVRLGPATHAAWTDEVLARENEDLLAWRDRYVAAHRPKRGA